MSRASHNSYLYYQVYEDTWQFDKKFESLAKMSPIQKLRPSYSSVQILVIVLF